MWKEFDNWKEADIALHKATDWKARRYEDLPTEETCEGTITIYRWNREPETHKATFRKFIRANAIFPPYYRMEKGVEGTLSAMYDGHKAPDGYDIHDRYEDQATYDLLSR